MANDTTKPVGAADIHVDPISEEAVVKMIAQMFNPIAYMEPEALQKNIRLACNGGFSKKDRSIRAELANYLISHFSLLMMGLVSNAQFRNMLRDAVAMEQALESEDAQFVEEARADMARDIPKVASKGSFVLNLSSYNDKVFRNLNSRFSASLERAAEYDDEISRLARDLDDESMSTIGYIVCNFMYLFRAFAQNPTFTSCVKSTFSDVQHQLGLTF